MEEIEKVTFGRYKKQKNDYSIAVKVDISLLKELEQTIDRLTKKAESLSNILSGLSANEGQSN